MAVTTETQQIQITQIDPERKATLSWLAAIVWLLPKRFRYRFFSQFHPKLHCFFSQDKRMTVNETDALPLRLPVQGEL